MNQISAEIQHYSNLLGKMHHRQANKLPERFVVPLTNKTYDWFMTQGNNCILKGESIYFSRTRQRPLDRSLYTPISLEDFDRLVLKSK